MKRNTLLFLQVFLLSSSLWVRDESHSKTVGTDLRKPKAIMKSNQVRATLKIVRSSSEGLELDLTAVNLGPAPVFVMTDPTRSDDSSGPYINATSGNVTLQVGIILYPPSATKFEINYTGVKLKSLQPMEELTQRLTLHYPIVETEPPYRETPSTAVINFEKVKRVQGAIGILEDEPGLRDFLDHKRSAPFVSGSEAIAFGRFKGRRLFELQSIVYTEEISLR